MNIVLSYLEFLKVCDWTFWSIEKAQKRELSNKEMEFLTDAFERLLLKLKIYVEE